MFCSCAACFLDNSSPSDITCLMISSFSRRRVETSPFFSASFFSMSRSLVSAYTFLSAPPRRVDSSSFVASRSRRSSASFSSCLESLSLAADRADTFFCRAVISSTLRRLSASRAASASRRDVNSAFKGPESSSLASTRAVNFATVARRDSSTSPVDPLCAAVGVSASWAALGATSAACVGLLSPMGLGFAAGLGIGLGSAAWFSSLVLGFAEGLGTSAVRSSRRKSSSLLDGTGSCRASEPTTAPGPVAAGPLTGVGAAALGLGAASSGLRATLAARLGIMSANKSSSACSAGDALVVSAGGEGTAFAFTDFPASAVASWGLGSASGAGPRLATRAGSREFGPGSRSAAGGGTGGVSCSAGFAILDTSFMPGFGVGLGLGFGASTFFGATPAPGVGAALGVSAGLGAGVAFLASTSAIKSSSPESTSHPPPPFSLITAPDGMLAAPPPSIPKAASVEDSKSLTIWEA
mmetsp:Transcript_7272/g.13649  ORF Transcript_7272/g.13649 Transcript_7272/m.13649 type:complete len:468 (-) Transcript_7272:153-1556(-)